MVQAIMMVVLHTAWLAHVVHGTLCYTVIFAGWLWVEYLAPTDTITIWVVLHKITNWRTQFLIYILASAFSTV